MIQNVGKALEVLSCFTISEPELGVSELASRLGMHKSTVHRILKTLEHYDFIVKNVQNQKYRLGFKLFDLGAVVISELEISDVVLPYMKNLCDETRETIAFNVADNDERVCVQKVESSESIRNVIPIGFRNPIYLTAAGKVLLSFLPPEGIERIIASRQFRETALGKNINPESLYDELILIRKQGFAFSNSDVSAGTSAIAAPIYNYEKKVIASISTHGPENRFMGERLNLLIEKTLDAAKQISSRLGYQIINNHREEVKS